jgi:DNA repair protein RadC
MRYTAAERELLLFCRDNPGTAERALMLLRPRPTTTVLDAATAADVLRPLIAGHPIEYLAAVYLDRRQRVLSAEVLSIGGHGYTVLDPKVILRRALALSAHAVILGHNHPSGDPEPSQEDLRSTRTLRTAADALGVVLADHIVLGDGAAFVSLAARGLL